ncbi:uncharacterized protein C8Q71DRAFT_719212 [Rhodofomes roseus]|uniref:Uncharacterized protein n=1 Tax=Rhodofomes roseus TaxID=34475 RepID=A0ABQ8JWZ9_9APHY|nr:uncharacterized protein C8Q71DRAFT_719212 [Rhodofomes roseus]KAH9828581.1 hypothetical protein C8Q71DRAFT_719212 [Rhodofomes roseus]
MNEVPLSHIPNMCFAKVGTHAKINIMFPALYASGESRKIPEDLLTMFYERVFRPSLVAINFPHIGHWPPSSAAAWALLRGVDGTLQFKTISIPSRSLRELATEVCRRMDEIREFKDAFWYHEVRGTKGGTLHNPHDDRQAADALHLAFKDLDFTKISNDDLAQRWFVDVGIEVRHPGHVVHWRSDTHMEVLQHAMPSAMPAAVESFKRGSNFTLDPCAQISDIAGFRAVTKTIGLGDGVRYINVYSTEKELHYQILKGTYKEIEPADFFPSKLARTMTRINVWTKALSDAAEKTQEASARYEVRVPANACGGVLREIPYDMLGRVCVSVRAKTWW